MIKFGWQWWSTFWVICGNPTSGFQLFGQRTWFWTLPEWIRGYEVLQKCVYLTNRDRLLQKWHEITWHLKNVDRRSEILVRCVILILTHYVQLVGNYLWQAHSGFAVAFPTYPSRVMWFRKALVLRETGVASDVMVRQAALKQRTNEAGNHHPSSREGNEHSKIREKGHRSTVDGFSGCRFVNKALEWTLKMQNLSPFVTFFKKFLSLSNIIFENPISRMEISNVRFWARAFVRMHGEHKTKIFLRIVLNWRLYYNYILPIKIYFL